jgi:hypothetical protein
MWWLRIKVCCTRKKPGKDDWKRTHYNRCVYCHINIKNKAPI